MEPATTVVAEKVEEERRSEAITKEAKGSSTESGASISETAEPAAPTKQTSAEEEGHTVSKEQPLGTVSSETAPPKEEEEEEEKPNGAEEPPQSPSSKPSADSPPLPLAAPPSPRVAAALSCLHTMNELQRCQRAYNWYVRCGMPHKNRMKERVKAEPTLGLTADDVDLLPWMAGGYIVDSAAMAQLQRSVM